MRRAVAVCTLLALSILGVAGQTTICQYEHIVTFTEYSTVYVTANATVYTTEFHSSESSTSSTGLSSSDDGIKDPVLTGKSSTTPEPPIPSSTTTLAFPTTSRAPQTESATGRPSSSTTSESQDFPTTTRADADPEATNESFYIVFDALSSATSRLSRRDVIIDYLAYLTFRLTNDYVTPKMAGILVIDPREASIFYLDDDNALKTDDLYVDISSPERLQGSDSLSSPTPLTSSTLSTSSTPLPSSDSFPVFTLREDKPEYQLVFTLNDDRISIEEVEGYCVTSDDTLVLVQDAEKPPSPCERSVQPRLVARQAAASSTTSEALPTTSTVIPQSGETSVPRTSLQTSTERPTSSTYTPSTSSGQTSITQTSITLSTTSLASTLIPVSTSAEEISSTVSSTLLGTSSTLSTTSQSMTMSDSSTTTESESGLVTSTTEDQIATSTSESATDSTEGVTTSKSMGIQPTTTSTSTSMEQMSASSTSTLTETTSSTTSETTTSTTSEITTSVTSEITTSNEASTTTSTTTTPVRCNPSATFSLTSFGSPQYPNDVPLLLAGGGEQFGAFGTGRPAELFTFDSSCHLIVQSVNKYAAVHGPSDVFSFLSLEEIGNYNRICTCGSDEDTDDPSQLNLGCACGSFGERVISTHYDGAVYATNFVGRSPFTGATGVKLRVRVVEPAVEGGGGGQSTTTSSDTSTTTSTTTTSTTTTSTRCNPTATFKLVSFDSSVYPDDVPVALNLYTNEAQAVFDGSRSAEVFSFDTSCHLVAQSQSVNKLFGVYGSPSNANFVPPGRSDTTYCTCGFNQDTEDVSSLILGCACGSLGERAFARYSGSKFILAVDPSEAQSYEPAKLKVRLIESEIEG